MSKYSVHTGIYVSGPYRDAGFSPGLVQPAGRGYAVQHADGPQADVVQAGGRDGMAGRGLVLATFCGLIGLVLATLTFVAGGGLLLAGLVHFITTPLAVALAYLMFLRHRD
ncbi:hypothetical protein [Pseudooceanicola algae]|uniref:Uncharacterized protein n=1 Tax=Pseudooceanicola algae TaxID=1537215 RepID=A0A418SJW6_9RHOB|nr:hypothetical protein [Pseudooceanicola algae]QPM88809.1 hypothetical protein PSAL_000110 [Pseudooceanicola algae]